MKCKRRFASPSERLHLRAASQHLRSPAHQSQRRQASYNKVPQKKKEEVEGSEDPSRVRADNLSRCDASAIMSEHHDHRRNELDEYYMRQALEVAKSALDVGEVPVGCVLVLNDASSMIDSTGAVSCSPSIGPGSKQSTDEPMCCYKASPSVIVSHGANQVNATRDATRHSEIVAIDRLLTSGRSSDQLKLPLDVISRSAHGKVPDSYSLAREKQGDKRVNVPECEGHWKNTFGWGTGRVYGKDVLRNCDLYVTCEPCIMVRG